MKKLEPEKPDNIGARLRMIRMRLGLTQVQMAEKLAISASQYSKAEIGMHNMGSAPLRLAAQIGAVDERWLISGGTRDAPPAAVKEARAVYCTRNLTKVPEDWKAHLDKAAAEKGMAFVAGVNDFRMPVRDAFEPVLVEFERLLNEKTK